MCRQSRFVRFWKVISTKFKVILYHVDSQTTRTSELMAIDIKGVGSLQKVVSASKTKTRQKA